MDPIDFLRRRIKFYLRGSLAIYIALGLAALVYLLPQIPSVGRLVAGTIFYQFALGLLYFVALPILIWGIALLVIALQIMARTAKIFAAYKKQSLIGGIAAAAFVPLCVGLYCLFVFFIATIWASVPIGIQLNWLVWTFFNPITLGAGLLVLHTILIRNARNLLLASPAAANE